MVNTAKLKGAMLVAGYRNVSEASKAIGMPPMTMYRKLKKGVFNSDEIDQMMAAFDIDTKAAMDIFFA